jgi:transcriptional regulator with XRE-family HTH domain
MANRFSWRTVGHRMRLTRIVLGLTAQEAADAYGLTLQTYRKYETGRPQRGTEPTRRFARKYGVSCDWLYDGEWGGIREHLANSAKGKVAILPALSPEQRRHLLDPRLAPFMLPTDF